MDKLTEFAKLADDKGSNTEGLDLEKGFPSVVQPARQWFNWLLNSLTKKINEMIDGIDSKLDKDATAQTAKKLVETRKIKISGVVQGEGDFDGSGDLTITTKDGATIGEKAIAVIRLNDSIFELVKSRGFASVVNVGGGQIEFTLRDAAPDTDYGVVCTGSSNEYSAVSLQQRSDFARTNTKFRLMGAFGGDNTQGEYLPSICTVVVYY
ncbi:hypothetical protein A7P21_15270 [Acinetobacter seifertii]|nr:hypothetical protein [Acinetobacter seifertii]OCZ58499.1 hypothetical protein A7P21_15270 [Acinetobacter seifertii]